MSENDKPESISERLKRASERANAAKDQKDAPAADPLSYDTIKEKVTGNVYVGNFFRDMYRRSKIVSRTYDTADVLWNKYLKPVSLFVNPVVNALWRFNKYAFNKASYNSDGDFNKYRAAPAVLLLAAFNYVAVVKAVPFTLKTTFDAAAVEGFSYEDTAVFSKPNWVSVEDNELNVFSCSKYPCRGEVDSIEYRLSDSPWLDIKYAWERFAPHDPGELAGAFLSEENVCNFTAYGRRIKLPFVNVKYGFWPHITEATCMPVNGDNVDEVLEQMRTLRQSQTPEFN